MKKFIFLSAIYLLLSTTVSAQSVDILWQGESYTPPFYEGKSLWSKQSVITLVAIPQGLGSASSLNYRWTRNGTVLGSNSGVGKNSLTYSDSLLSKSIVIMVEIVDTEENVLTSSSITVTPVIPQILVYERNPLYGYMFHDEVGDIFNLSKSEVTFTAFPLFSDPAIREGSLLAYRWRTNNGPAQEGGTITYRVPEGEKGLSKVSLSLTNSTKVLPALTKDFLIQFGNE